MLDELRTRLAAAADPARAPRMQAYMKSAMPYHGVASPVGQRIYKDVFKDVAFPDAAAWQAAVRAIWHGAAFREERYAALALAGHRAAKGFQTPEALRLYEELIVDGAWWDFVDDLATHHVGALLRAHPAAIRPAMLAWSQGDDMWKRRTAIICQVGAKDAIDLELLYACIEPALASKEFFLRKAIGWALRQHAWRDPEEVKRYVAAQADRLSPLSRREALKNL
ncbi:MAG: alkylation repair enzyme [Cyanobacteria bacterium RYN_339]|nr:alkylation repair enzyme [Cyanobacteria bacterium RYN_339]